jgi:hypothetical protein
MVLWKGAHSRCEFQDCSCKRIEAPVCCATDKQRNSAETLARRDFSIVKTIKLGVFLALPLALGASQIFTTPTGSSTTDGSVNAQATFTLVNVGGVNELQLTLQDLLPNATSVGQLLSDFQFQISGVTNLTLLSSSAQSISIADNGSTTMGSTGSTGWVGGSFGGGFIVCAICPQNFPKSSGPADLIIGPGPYTNANGSIAGNQPHNPFLDQTATFTFTGTGLTSSSVVSNAVFSFGTQFGSDVAASGGSGTVGGGPGGGETPEPSTYFLSAAALGMLGLARRRKQSVS